MSHAFEITSDDIQTVLIQLHLPSSDADVAQAAERLRPHDARVTRAALRGNDLDEQTRYAHEEIADILRAPRDLPPGP